MPKVNETWALAKSTVNYFCRLMNGALLSEKNHMKTHKNQCLVSLLSLPISLVELRTMGHTLVSGVQMPS